MAPNRRHPQPAQALPPPDRRRAGGAAQQLRVRRAGPQASSRSFPTASRECERPTNMPGEQACYLPPRPSMGRTPHSHITALPAHVSSAAVHRRAVPCDPGPPRLSRPCVCPASSPNRPASRSNLAPPMNLSANTIFVLHVQRSSVLIHLPSALVPPRLLEPLNRTRPPDRTSGVWGKGKKSQLGRDESGHPPMSTEERVASGTANTITAPGTASVGPAATATERRERRHRRQPRFPSVTRARSRPMTYWPYCAPRRRCRTRLALVA
jgi:hypothetical protein